MTSSQPVDLTGLGFSDDDVETEPPTGTSARIITSGKVQKSGRGRGSDGNGNGNAGAQAQAQRKISSYFTSSTRGGGGGGNSPMHGSRSGASGVRGVRGAVSSLSPPRSPLARSSGSGKSRLPVAKSNGNGDGSSSGTMTAKKSVSTRISSTSSGVKRPSWNASGSAFIFNQSSSSSSNKRTESMASRMVGNKNNRLDSSESGWYGSSKKSRPEKNERAFSIQSSSSSRRMPSERGRSGSRRGSGSGSGSGSPSSSLREAARYAIATQRRSKSTSTSSSSGGGDGVVHLVISQGSVLDYHHPNGAIVNAANEGCLGGGGVDAAISKAGGRELFLDRRALPILREGRGGKSSSSSSKSSSRGSSSASRSRSGSNSMDLGLLDLDPIRCFTGDAVITGPNTYGSIGTPYVIHAVGPAYYGYNNLSEADDLLRGAYRRSLERARDARIEGVAFSLLSAGVFRGPRSLKSVLRIGVEAIRDFAQCGGYVYNSDDGDGGIGDDDDDDDGNDRSNELSVKEVHMCAFNSKELEKLLRIAQDMGLEPSSPL